MGLLRMAARTAVVAGTATAVSGRVARRQAAKYDQQASRRRPPPQQAAAEPAPDTPAPGRNDRQAAAARAAAQPGCALRRGVRGRQGQSSRDLTDGGTRVPASTGEWG